MRTWKSFGRTTKAGFTLTEILVVIGILALLVAVLLPVFASARRRAQQSACVSNFRQLQAACSLYAQDSDGLLPPYPSRATNLPGTNGLSVVEESSLLLTALDPYVHSRAVWRCPSDTSRPDVNEISGGLPVPDLTSYTYHGFQLVYQGLIPIRLDYNSVMFTSSTRELMRDSGACPNNPAFARYNHGGRWNRIFLDGHAKSFSWDCATAPYITETP